MTFDFSFAQTQSWTEILIGISLILQSSEYLKTDSQRRLFHFFRILLAVLLVIGVAQPIAAISLLISGLWLIQKFQGPYNGGSDRMGLLVLFVVASAQLSPDPKWAEYAYGYLAIQVLLSYFMAGVVKLKNPDWRSGKALSDLFLRSAYPVQQKLRSIGNAKKTLQVLAIVLLGFELLFPFSLLHPATLAAALIMAFIFHLTNAWILGLNRFVWAWLAAYPAILWLQSRLSF